MAKNNYLKTIATNEPLGDGFASKLALSGR